MDTLGRSYLEGGDGNFANAILTEARYNFRLMLKWMTIIARDCRCANLCLRAPDGAQTHFITQVSGAALSLGENDLALASTLGRGSRLHRESPRCHFESTDEPQMNRSNSCSGI